MLLSIGTKDYISKIDNAFKMKNKIKAKFKSAPRWVTADLHYLILTNNYMACSIHGYHLGI